MFGVTYFVAEPDDGTGAGVRHAVELGADHTACERPLTGLVVTDRRWPDGADGAKGRACDECSDAAV